MSFSGMQPSPTPPQAGSQQRAYSGPRTPPEGARINDLSERVPANQIWAQAYNQASKQHGGNTQARSWTMPGYYTKQSYNPKTDQYSQPTSGPSWDGNLAYNAIDKRPGPIQATGTGIDGKQMPWQETMSQREAFVGNLSQRLNQYNSGQLTGPVTFDPSQLMAQADDQLAKGTFVNPFAQPVAPASTSARPIAPTPIAAPQSPAVQGAMDNATQYMQGNFQNPFGNSLQANNPMPSWGQQSYDPRVPQQGAELAPMLDASTRRTAPSAAQPIQPPSQGTRYNPQDEAQSLPPVPTSRRSTRRRR